VDHGEPPLPRLASAIAGDRSGAKGATAERAPPGQRGRTVERASRPPQA
jgi:hypothetical protein